jgi:hypothetical protein
MVDPRQTEPSDRLTAPQQPPAVSEVRALSPNSTTRRGTYAGELSSRFSWAGAPSWAGARSAERSLPSVANPALGGRCDALFTTPLGAAGG